MATRLTTLHARRVEMERERRAREREEADRIIDARIAEYKANQAAADQAWRRELTKESSGEGDDRQEW
ncbi:hypothetical protein BJF83_13130 [Nocardiopsis sp. CNR-923]|uniref:hypothetical protein n=1 Tax=Nocardiopsis sp. CNR-923 TaxID=1904965 RepID=UPI00096952D7|nr:hypothetical protein [Nocardiopsis sp. CNR-923]OLT29040.1 hypothetical protein BJF83_13130 [Nocardiopsis sp. CNR-923]